MPHKRNDFVTVLLFITSLIFSFVIIFKIDFLPIRFRIIAYSLVMSVLMFLLIVTKRVKTRVIFIVLINIVTIISITYQREIDAIANQEKEEVQSFSLYRQKDFDDPIEDIYMFGIRALYHENIIEQFSESINFHQGNDLEDILKDIRDKEHAAILLPSNIILDDPNYNLLNQYDVVISSYRNPRKVDIKSESYSIFVTSVDIQGDVVGRSLTYFNSVVTVNPKIYHVDRLSFNPFMQMWSVCDKGRQPLYELGLFGIDCQVDSYEALLGMDINYYIRINVSGLSDLIDSVGGLDLNLNQESKSHYFGSNIMNVIRQENNAHLKAKMEEEMLDALLEKMFSEENIINLPKQLLLIRNVLDTNLNDREFSQVIANYLEKVKQWDLTERELATMVDFLDGSYVLIPDMESINKEVNEIEIIKKKVSRD